MKTTFNILIPIFLFLLFSCSKTEKHEKSLEWMQGKWIRLGDKPQKTTYEIWKDTKGLGYTLQEKDTLFKELMSIVKIKDTLFLKVEVVNEHPTLFKFTQQTDTSFISENRNNEFPQKIYYYMENKQLKAEVSNDDFKINFVFEKVE